MQGRPKHLYSIWKKMQGKQLDFAQVFDMRALRVIVPDVPDCYAVLARVHERWPAVAGEFDDYIARPKANGYQSLHTVVRDDDGRPVEIQIRTRRCTSMPSTASPRTGPTRRPASRAMPASARAAATTSASPRRARRCCASCWPGSATSPAETARRGGAVFDDRIYVFTPQATVVELPAGRDADRLRLRACTPTSATAAAAPGSTARMVPLNTPLPNGQTVEIIAAKEGGPSLDWLNPELGYLAERALAAKVRAWFNAQATGADRSRAAARRWRRLLQREGKTALKLDDLAAQLGFKQRRGAVRGGRQGRVLAAQHRDSCCARPRRRPADEAPLLKRSRAADAARAAAACWWSASIRC